MTYHGSSRTFSSPLWTVLLFLLSACSDHYGSIGPPALNRESVSGGDMSLHAGVPGGSGTADGVGANARFNLPYGVAAYGVFLYVADRSNHSIRSVDLGTRQVTTLAGFPGRSGTSNGRGKDARFNSPEGVAVSADGKILYVADTGNHAIRKITLETAEVVTLSGRRGTAGSSDSTNGRGDTATFRYPGALTVYGSYLYVADSDNNRIRRLNTATGETVTLIGSGAAGHLDGFGREAILNTPLGIVGATESSGGVLYVSETRVGGEESHAIRRVDLSTLEVTTVAGVAGVAGFDDGPALQATFNAPTGLVYAGGRLYIADQGNSMIREYNPESLQVRTVAGVRGYSGPEDGPFGVGLLSQPTGLAVWGGFLYTGDHLNHAVRRVDLATGELTTVAGAAAHPGSGDGPPGIGRFRNPSGGVIDGGFLFLADAGNHTIRRVNLETGEAVTVAGRPRWAGTTDSNVSPAFFDGPRDVVLDDASGALFIVDTENHAIRRMVLETGVVTTFAGSPRIAGYADSTLDSSGNWVGARFNMPRGILRIGDFFYLADMANHAIRVVEISTGRVTTLAGYSGEAGTTDGIGAAARFVAPKDLTTDGTFLYVADGILPDTDPVQANHVIRRIDPGTGEVVTLVGGAGQAGYEDSICIAWGDNGQLDTSPSGNDVILESSYMRIISPGSDRVCDSTASGDDVQVKPPGSTPVNKLNDPSGVFYRGGVLYISDAGNYAIRKFDLASGDLTTLAGDRTCSTETTSENGAPVEKETCTGTPTSLSNFTDSTSETDTKASFASPAGLSADDRYLYIMDTGNSSLRRLELGTNRVKTVAGGFRSPTGIDFVNDRFLYLADTGNQLVRVVDLLDPDLPVTSTLAGNMGLPSWADSPGYEARFYSPSGVAADGAGNLYITDTGNSTIRKLNLTTGTVTTLAGIPGATGYVNSAFGSALFNNPRGIVWDSDHLFVADTGNHLIRRITLTTGRVSLVAGHGDERTGTGTAGTEDSTGQAAGFNAPQGITSDATYLYVTDTGNHTIRRILKATGEVRTIGGMPREIGSIDDVGFNARFNAPQGVANDGDSLYIADSGNNLVRKLDKNTRQVATLSGVVRQSSFTPGPPSEVRYGALTGIVTAPELPDLYIVDGGENVVGRVTK